MASRAYEWTAAGPAAIDRLIGHLERRRAAGDRIVTTNGCFDLLHPGHLRFLEAARAQGDLLVVGLNSDESVRRLKGAGRPLIAEGDRAAMLLALRTVDHVVVFDEQLPNDLLSALRPAVHCKAGDYRAETLPEAAVVRQGGGEVRILPLVDGHSTSRLVERAQSSARSPVAETGRVERADERAWVVDRLMSDANLLRQTAYGLSETIVQLALGIGRALRDGGRVLLCDGAGTSFARQAAAVCVECLGADFAARVLALAACTQAQPVDSAGELASPGDLLLVFAQADGELCPRMLSIARACDMAILAGESRRPVPIDAALYLAVPEQRPARLRLAHLAIVQTACELVSQSIAFRQ